MSIESQGLSSPYIFQVLYVLCFTRPRYQVSVYRTIGPLVSSFVSIATVLKFQTPKMFVLISLECKLRDNCPAGVDEPANSADPDQTAHRTAPLGAV